MTLDARTLTTALACLVAAVLAAVGGAAVVLGELDDSPGLSGLGGLLVLAVAGVLARGRTRDRACPSVLR